MTIQTTIIYVASALLLSACGTVVKLPPDSPDPQAIENKQVCLEEWSKTKATAESLLERNLDYYAISIAEKCEKFWTTTEQKALAEHIRTTVKLKGDLAAAEKLKRDLAVVEKDAEKTRKYLAETEKRSSQGVRIGMSRERVRQSSWGDPIQVNRTTTANGVNEQWVYGGYPIAIRYLYFENGNLTAIQN